MDNNYEKAIEDAFLMTTKVDQNMIKAMCDVTGATYCEMQKKISFTNLLDEIIEMSRA